jgi:hypothetical protein
MTRHWTWILSLLVAAGCVFLYPQQARADRIDFKDGTSLEGIIKKVDNGKVTVQVGQETKEFSVLDITRMEFETFHLTPGASRLPPEHFLATMEAQEILEHVQEVEKAAAEVRTILDETRKQWQSRKTITVNDVPQWDAAKDRIGRALSRYQEVLVDFYLHVAGKAEEYDRLTKEGNDLYIGVKGIFNVGSPLISKDQMRLPLKKFVPSNWYDTIYYAGYDAGYTQGYYGARPEEMVAPR